MTAQSGFTWSTNDASQRERVLALLHDGQKHTTREFVRLGVLRISARVLELRREGWLIHCDGERGRYEYWLTGKGEPVAPPLSWKRRALAAEAELARLRAGG